MSTWTPPPCSRRRRLVSRATLDRVIGLARDGRRAEGRSEQKRTKNTWRKKERRSGEKKDEDLEKKGRRSGAKVKVWRTDENVEKG
eukprot:scaffold3691_cov107-Pinguiococcus_pyrenoidosus.AAC.1